jgi:hypothetical protein
MVTFRRPQTAVSRGRCAHFEALDFVPNSDVFSMLDPFMEGCGSPCLHGVAEDCGLRHRPRVLTTSRRTAACGNGPASPRRRGGPCVAVTAPRPHGVAADRMSR